MAKAPSKRTQLKRLHKRGSYDRPSLDAILDASMFCHVAYMRDEKPSITPTMHWRTGDHVYWHGSAASSALRAQTSMDVSLCVTHIDGFVFARSAINHSVNYRCAILYGEAHKVTDLDVKEAELKRMVDLIAPGRWEDLRPMTSQELKATSVLSLSIDEASAKVREGGPVDDLGDMEHPVWAGHQPMRMIRDTPIADPANLAGLDVPDYLKE